MAAATERLPELGGAHGKAIGSSPELPEQLPSCDPTPAGMEKSPPAASYSGSTKAKAPTLPTIPPPNPGPPPSSLSSFKARAEVFVEQSDLIVTAQHRQGSRLSQALSPTPQDCSVIITRSWTEMTPEELKAWIADAIAPLHQSNEALRKQVEDLTADKTQMLSSQASARQTELEARKKMIDDELKAIADKSWKGPLAIR